MNDALVFAVTAVVLAIGADDAALPWSANPHPGDVAKTRVEEVTAGSHHYTIKQGGTMDGRNCRSPMGCAIAREGALLQNWESNRSVRMENVVQTDLINQWLSNGRNLFRKIDVTVTATIDREVRELDEKVLVWGNEKVLARNALTLPR